MKRVDLKTATDAELLTCYLEGRADAFAAIVERYGGLATGVALRAIRNRADADDVVQAMFMALAASAKRIADRGTLGGWIFKATQLCASKHATKNARWNRAKEILRIQEDPKLKEVSEENSVDATELNETLRILDEEIARLTPELRVPVVLCHLNGMTRSEAAQQLGIAAATVTKRLATARDKIRLRLTQRGITAGIGGVLAAASASSVGKPLEAAIVSDITSIAFQYSSGKTAAEIGIEPELFDLAGKVVTSMSASKGILIGAMALLMVLAAGSAPAFLGGDSGSAAAGTLLIDTFADGDHADGDPMEWARPGGPTNGIVDSSSGDLVLTQTESTSAMFGFAVFAEGIASIDQSVRSQGRVTESGGSMIVIARLQDPDEPLNYTASVAYRPELGGNIFVTGRSNGIDEELHFFNSTSGQPVVPLSFDVRESDAVVQIDVIGDSIRAWAWKAGDPMPDEPQFDLTDSIHNEPGFAGLGILNADNSNSSTIFRYVQVADRPIHELPQGDVDGDGVISASDVDAIVAGISSNDGLYDLDSNGEVGFADAELLVTEIAKTWIGDVDFDGEFNSGDFVQVFKAGEYEDAIPGNSTWATGDWNGDGEFDSGDFVLAFSDGGYEKGQRPALIAVPEPSFVHALLLIGTFALTRLRSPRSRR